jgi:PST family polysaccharide transporter
MPSTQLIEQNDEAPPKSETPENQQSPGNTYGQILRSSVLVGGSSVLNVGIGILRTKAMALLLGPAGFGLFGLYNSIATLAQTISGMGVNSSGVRQIAEAVGSKNNHRIALTATILKRVSLWLGLIGAMLLVCLSFPISQLTFGTKSHSGAVALLGIVVFLSSLSAGQTALIQGTRRITALAKLSVLGSLYGLAVSVPLIYLFRERGVVPALIAIAAMTAATSYWYSTKIKLVSPVVTAFELTNEMNSLIKLGFAFMISGLMTIGVGYFVRIIVFREIGYEATGLYQAAWTLGGLYVGIILQSMGADFYPRLTANVENNTIVNRLVNEQAEVGLLLAGPGVLATLAVAPLVISVFYSAKFMAAVGLLRWVCLGTFIQVISWPIGFIVVAKAYHKLFIVCELTWAIVSVTLALFCVSHFGLIGAGIAFLGSYIAHGALMYVVVHRLTGFGWSKTNLKLGAVFSSAILVVFGSSYLLTTRWALSMALVITVACTLYSTRILSTLVAFESAPQPLRKILTYISDRKESL